MTKQPKVSSRDGIDAALNRLLCDLALGSLLDVANCSSELVALVVGLGSPVLTPLIADVAVAGTTGDLERSLAAFSEAWSGWNVQSAARSAPVSKRAKRSTTRSQHDSVTAVETAAHASHDEPATPVPTSMPTPVQSSHVRVDEDVAALQGDPELAAMFIGEALDHLSSIEACVLQLEAAPGDTKLLNDIFRPFHTVKGNAGALGVTRVQELRAQGREPPRSVPLRTPHARPGRDRCGARSGGRADGADQRHSGAAERPARHGSGAEALQR